MLRGRQARFACRLRAVSEGGSRVFVVLPWNCLEKCHIHTEVTNIGASVGVKTKHFHNTSSERYQYTIFLFYGLDGPEIES